MALEIVTPAAIPAVTLAEVRTWCMVDDTSFDPALQLMLDAALIEIEDIIGRSLGEQDLRLSLDAFADPLELPAGPVLAVDSVKYLDAAGTLQTVAGADYVTDLVSVPARIVPALGASWPSAVAALPNAVRIEFSAGYIAETLPAPLKRAVLTLTAAWFANRESGEVPKGVMQAIEPYRTAWICA